MTPKKLLFVPDIMERYHVCDQTARRYIHEMEHMTKPLCVTEEAVAKWDEERTKKSKADTMRILVEEKKRKPKKSSKIPQRPQNGKFLISRVRAV